MEDALGAQVGISAREYEFGGRLVNRIRKTWLVRTTLRYPKIKHALKKTLSKI